MSLEEYFNSRIKNLNYREDTRAYVSSTLDKYKNSTNDLSNKSLTLEYAEAKFESSFKKMNDIADYILFMEIIFNGNLSGATTEYYHAIAQMAYYKCHILMQRKWILFEELSDRFPELIKNLHAEMKLF